MAAAFPFRPSRPAFRILAGMPSPAHPEAASPAETRRDRLLRRDSAATQAVARLPHPRWLTAPYGAFSLSANYGLLWFVIAAVPWIAGASHGARTFVFVAGSVLVTEWITYGLKLIVGRRRPALVDPTLGGHIPLPRSHSFPSSHASMGMAGLLTMGSLYPVSAPSPRPADRPALLQSRLPRRALPARRARRRRLGERRSGSSSSSSSGR